MEAGLILLNILCYGDIRWLLLEQILLFPCFNVLKRKKREKEKHLYLHIQDKTVSREHAVILEDIYEGDGQGYILRDMGSTNGTWLNGKKIKRGNQEQLEDGAVIRFAKKEYEFLIQDI